MTKEAIISADDFVENTAPRLPICFCLDYSFSMMEVFKGSGNYKRVGETFEQDGKTYSKVLISDKDITKKKELEDSVQSFLDSIKEDPQAAASAEISVISFNDKVNFLVESTNVTEIKDISYPTPEGNTHLYEGILHALDLLEERKERYKEEGAQYFQPWLVLVTDGKPEGDTEANKTEALRRLRDLHAHKKINLFPVCIEKDGKDDGIKAIAELVPGVMALNFESGDFSRFFSFLSQSAVAQSSSACIEAVEEVPMVSGIVMEGLMLGRFDGKAVQQKPDGSFEKKNLRDLFPETSSWNDGTAY